jgi:hypothetical protein
MSEKTEGQKLVESLLVSFRYYHNAKTAEAATFRLADEVLTAATERGRHAGLREATEQILDAADTLSDHYDACAITCNDMDRVAEHRAAEGAIKQFASSIRARIKEGPSE